MPDPSHVESIFLAALNINEATERAAYLDSACGTDSELRRRVERLLNAHPQAADFLARPAFQGMDLQTNPESNAPPPGGDTEHVEPLDPADDEGDDALAHLQPSDEPGSLGRLAHYEVLEILGRGTFGTVVKAFDVKLQRHVAVKLLAPVLAATSTSRRRFMREARLAAAVRHDNVIAIYAVEDHPSPYLVMEHIAGRTLQQKLDTTGPLELVDVLRIGWQTADGLAAAHAAGLVHRDIKPANILLDGDVERVKITDFGLARAADDAGGSQAGLLAGTPMYMAPEQALGATVDQRADLFSLGSVLYAMSSGRPPFHANTTMSVLRRVAEDTPQPIRELSPEVPDWLCELIAALHRKAPADRIATARQVADLLAHRLAALQGGPPVAPWRLTAAGRPGEEPPRKPWRRPGRPWLVAAAFLPTLLLGAGLGEATGFTNVRGTVIRLFSPQGTLVVEVDDPAVSVQIAGSDLVITGAGVKEIRLRPGLYAVEAIKDGEVVSRELVDVIRDGRRVVRILQMAGTALPLPDAPVDPDRLAASPAEAASWVRSVSKLPAVERVKAVALRMQELNPGFDGALGTTIERGVVRGLDFHTDHVTDLAPLRVLTGLRFLRCAGSDAFSGQLIDGAPSTGDEEGHMNIRTVDKSQLVDLSPLNGLPLTKLECFNSHVYDLEPLRGMKLTELGLGSTSVHDLSPLKGMPLEWLDCAYTKVADLSPLEGMPLTRATFDGTDVSDLSPLRGMALTHLGIGRGVSDLSPLEGMPLHELGCADSKVADLTPLRGLPIWLLSLANTPVTDLEPLRGMTTLKRLYCSDQVANLTPLEGLKLEFLYAGPLVTDLSPVREMPLNKITFPTFKAERDAEILRAIPTLQTINDRPAAEFWREINELANK